MLEIEIIEVNQINDGVEVFARAWQDGAQIGFGQDGTIDIERFRIFNPPVLVEDPLGDIVQEGVFNDCSVITSPPRILREDPEEAILQSIEHTILVMKNKVAGSDKIISGKRGNTTSTFYPAAGANSPVDGWVQRSVTSESWTTTRDATTASTSVGSPTSVTTDFQVAQGEYCSVCGGRYIINRNVILFDTSAIPDGDSISAATLSLYGAGGGDTTNGDSAAIVSCAPAATNNLAAGDYNKANWGTTDFATRQSLSTLNSSGYKDFALNSAGIANISKTGISYFGSRSANDIDNVTPTQRGYTFMRSADFTGTSNDPKLVVEHSTGSTPQAVTANARASATIATIKSFKRTLTAATRTSAVTGLVKSFKRTLTANARASATVLTIKTFTQTLTAAIEAAADIASANINAVVLTASVVTQATITNIKSLKRTLTANSTVAGTVDTLKTLHRTLTAATTAAASIISTKTFFQTLTATVRAAAEITRGDILRTVVLSAIIKARGSLGELFYKIKYRGDDEDYKRKY